MSNLDDLPKKLVELKGSASAKESKVSKPAKAQPKKAATKKITAKAQVKPKATTNNLSLCDEEDHSKGSG